MINWFIRYVAFMLSWPAVARKRVSDNPFLSFPASRIDGPEAEKPAAGRRSGAGKRLRRSRVAASPSLPSKAGGLVASPVMRMPSQQLGTSKYPVDSASCWRLVMGAESFRADLLVIDGLFGFVRCAAVAFSVIRPQLGHRARPVSAWCRRAWRWKWPWAGF